MKKTNKDYLKIALTFLIIAGLFLPYIYNVLPYAFIFDDYMDLERLFALTIPILVTIPLLLLLIFKSFLKEPLVKVLIAIFYTLYFIILIDYGYGFYDSLDLKDFKEHLPFIVSMVFSLALMVLSFKSYLTKQERLETILLSIIGFPILLYFTYGLANDLENLNYGCYVLSISFISLYIMELFNIYKNRKLKINIK